MMEDDSFNVRVPTRKVDTGNGKFVLEKLSLSDRLRYLELKTNGFMNWGNHYDMDSHFEQAACSKSTSLIEFDPKCPGQNTDERENNCPGLFDHTVCLDNFPPAKPISTKAKCLVYDFGIREQPEFGVTMADHFGCEVHAFDPSPVSTKWAETNLKDGSRPNYHFHPYGAGGTDGTTTLYEYDWGQVSILNFPRHVDLLKCLRDKECSHVAPDSKEFSLPVRTLPSIMEELGHTHIDVLKLDVEGSEYIFLEQLLDHYGCPPCDQITMEWHHFTFDQRYGAGSSPSINAISTVLRSCGFRQFYHYTAGGWPSSEYKYAFMGMMDVRYNIVSFIKQ